MSKCLLVCCMAIVVALHTLSYTTVASAVVYGSYNFEPGSTGGNNIVVVNDPHGDIVYGSRNYGTNSNGGGNTVTNHD